MATWRILPRSTSIRTAGNTKKTLLCACFSVWRTDAYAHTYANSDSDGDA